MGLEFEGEGAEEGEAGEGDVADLGEAVAFWVASAGVEGAVDPSAGGLVGVEEVVEVEAEDGLLEASLTAGEGVAEGEVEFLFVLFAC